MHGMDYLPTKTLCPFGKVMFVHRTPGDVDYMESLREILSDRLEAFWRVAFVDPVGWVWSRQHLLI